MELKKEKAIVKYNNRFNLSNINKLTKMEMDIFFSICSEFTSTKKDSLKIDIHYLKSKAKLTDRSFTEEQYRKMLVSLEDKIRPVYFSVETEEGIETMPLFKRFFRPKNGLLLELTLNDCFKNYLYDIPEKIAFTKFELEYFLALKSKYSKNLLRFLLERFSGKWEVPFPKFREMLGFPEVYKATQVLQTVDKAIEQLTNLNLFNGLKYEIEKSRAKGSPIKTIKFTYYINKSKLAELQGQTTIGDCIIDMESRNAFKGYIEVPSDDPQYEPQLQPIYEVVTEEAKCPLCGSRIMVRTGKKGNKYRACENSKYIHLNGTKSDCRFYEPLDEDE